LSISFEQFRYYGILNLSNRTDAVSLGVAVFLS
jgi:hypothetical protein